MYSYVLYYNIEKSGFNAVSALLFWFYVNKGKGEGLCRENTRILDVFDIIYFKVKKHSWTFHLIFDECLDISFISYLPYRGIIVPNGQF